MTRVNINSHGYLSAAPLLRLENSVLIYSHASYLITYVLAKISNIVTHFEMAGNMRLKVCTYCDLPSRNYLFLCCVFVDYRLIA